MLQDLTQPLDTKTLVTDARFSALDSIAHGFASRENTDNTHSYLPNDDGSNAQEVQNNHQILQEALGAPHKPLCLLKQTHSNIVHFVGDDWDHSTLIEGDGLVTNRRDVILGVRTADCVPLLLCDTENQLIATAHAGWKGARIGIVENTIDMLCKHGANKSSLHALIGPAIAEASYEVGDEFYDQFMYDSPENAAFFIQHEETGHWHFNLPGYVAYALASSGVKQIYQSGLDTFADETPFFSYRWATKRGESLAGHTVSILRLKG